MILFQNKTKPFLYGALSVLMLVSSTAHAILSPAYVGVFAKVIAKSLWNSATLKKEVDRDWKKVYQDNDTETDNPAQAAKILREAIAQNPYNINPEEFLLGASSSAYQVEGRIGEECATDRFYKKHGLPRAGKAIDFWNKFEIYLKQLKELGLNSFRLSISWPRIEKQQGQINHDAIKTYQNIIKICKKYELEVILVLNHYTVPSWFEDKGGFLNEKNIDYFVKFATTMYEALASDIRYWSTFNAIEGYAFKGYHTGECSPGEKGNLQSVAQVMAHMLEAHVRFYQAIKGNGGLYHQLKKQNQDIPEPQIGLQKNIHQLDPSNKTLFHKCLSFISRIICSIGNMIQNDGFYGFFTNGKFRVYIPFKVKVFHENKNAPYSLDWIGVNTYSNRYMFITKTVKENDPKLSTENKNYRFYTEGVHRAVKEVSKRIAEPVGRLKNKDKSPIPIIITENGIATKSDDAGNKKRYEFYKKVLGTIIPELIKDGYNVIGYTPWASHDNFEWHSKDDQGNWVNSGVGKKRYGLFHVDFENIDQPPTLKQGAEYYRDFVQAFFQKPL